MIKVIVKLSVTFERFISATLAYTLFLDLSKPPKSIKSPTGGLALSFPLSVKPLLAPKSCSLIALSNASVLRNFQSISVCLDRHYKIFLTDLHNYNCTLSKNFKLTYCCEVCHHRLGTCFSNR